MKSNAPQNLSPLAVLVLVTGLFVAIWSNDRPVVAVAQPVPTIEQPYDSSDGDSVPFTHVEDTLRLDDCPLLAAEVDRPDGEIELAIPCTSESIVPHPLKPDAFLVVDAPAQINSTPMMITPDELIESTLMDVAPTAVATAQANPFAIETTFLSGSTGFSQLAAISNEHELRCFSETPSANDAIERTVLSELRLIR